MPSKTNLTVTSSSPLAGFWEWDIRSRQENISKNLAEAFSLQHPFSREEGEFWKTILSATDFQSFIELRTKVSRKKQGAIMTTVLQGITALGEVTTFEIQMETVAWNDSGEAEKMIGHVAINKPDQNSENNPLHRKLTEHVPGVVYQYQYLDNGLSRFPYASDGLWDIFEHTPEEVKADAASVFDRIHADDLDAFIQSMLHSYTSLNPWKMDFRVVLPSKGKRWINGSATPEKQDDESVIWHGYMACVRMKHRLNEC
ncbi:MAG: PAS domain-containing protein, partial [Imperialibacter sp.]